jgi:hypothetical protein
MATPLMATGAAALGFFVWLRKSQQCGHAGVLELPLPAETHARTEQPPASWTETLYLFREGLRCAMVVVVVVVVLLLPQLCTSGWVTQPAVLAIHTLQRARDTQVRVQ